MVAAAKLQNAIFLIAPYWQHGTWVFDDPAVGLVREPFVAGVPEILNELVSRIPAARSGFRLLFSSRPFPGYHAEFVKAREEQGGTWYRSGDSGDKPVKEGWLCPALFKYYATAPERLYVRVEAL